MVHKGSAVMRSEGRILGLEVAKLSGTRLRVQGNRETRAREPDEKQ